MLQTLRIRNVALIERLEILFSTGFHVLTGETGAGKSILIDAVNFVLGERANRDLIKSGEDKASVEAAFDIDACPDVLARLEELGIEHEAGDVLIISRELTVAGKSVCRVNGMLMNLSSLKSITDLLMDVHGQHEHQSLLNVDTHLAFLDASDPALPPLRQRVAALYRQHRDIKKTLLSGFPSEQDRLRRMDVLKYQIQEISEARLREGEEEELTAQLTLLSNAQAIMAALEGGYALLAGDDGGALNAASAALRELAGIERFHADYAQAHTRLQDAYYAMEDVAYTLRDLKDGSEFQPALLEQTEARISRIHLLERKYGRSIPEILAFLEQVQQEYDGLQQSDERRAKLARELDSCAKQYRDAAESLMHARQTAARELEKRLMEELQGLGMEHARFEAALTPLAEDAFTETGLERVEFLLSANVGEPLKPLSRVASGGELSRIMLAFKAVQMGSIPTVIFDEIDTGISGRIAAAVGRKLKGIAAAHQVLCVTHLAQIAAMADVHFLVEKAEVDGRTSSSVRELSKGERVQEIARIMGANEGDASAMAHARELLERGH